MFNCSHYDLSVELIWAHAIGDAINMAARLSSSADPGQIVVSNLVHRDLCGDMQKMLQEARPVEAKNVGKIKAWVYDHFPESI